jgi:hypothetical protein
MTHLSPHTPAGKLLTADRRVKSLGNFSHGFNFGKNLHQHPQINLDESHESS